LKRDLIAGLFYPKPGQPEFEKWLTKRGHPQFKKWMAVVRKVKLLKSDLGQPLFSINKTGPATIKKWLASFGGPVGKKKQQCCSAM
jgi:hypothetical protein